MTNVVSIAQSGANNVTMRNRLINGGMVIDQRNAGASGTGVGPGYPVDRWLVFGTQGSKLTWQQTPSATETGYATRVAAGFTSYLSITSSSAYSVLSTDRFFIGQTIEGLNAGDFAFGTANAKTVTLSFLVYSSLTGTFGGALQNYNGTRSYPFTFAISSANTWTSISITIAGDTSGTWLTTNSGWGTVTFGLGAGSTYSGTAGAWAGANYNTATGATSVVGTNGATFYITGVQLEKGSTATPFEQRLYTTELQLCQRYLPAFAGTTAWFGFGVANTTASGYCTATFPVTARVAPSGITVSNVSHFTATDVISLSTAPTTIVINNANNQTALIYFTVASGATQGRPTTLVSASASANLYFTGCEL